MSGDVAHFLKNMLAFESVCDSFFCPICTICSACLKRGVLLTNITNKDTQDNVEDKKSNKNNGVYDWYWNNTETLFKLFGTIKTENVTNYKKCNYSTGEKRSSVAFAKKIGDKYLYSMLITNRCKTIADRIKEQNTIMFKFCPKPNQTK